jgi:hypothetical protein
LNPFTQSLIQRLKDPQLVEFVYQWDSLEALVIRVFKGKAAALEDEIEYGRLRSWLLEHYPTWEEAVRSYWPLALIAGQPPQEDPFAFLLAVPRAFEYVGNSTAMRTLPAARQTLNQFLIDQIGKEDE